MSDRPSRTAYDVVIVGGGHNGLVAGAYLARAEHSVLILERRAVLGGCATSEAAFPGYRVDVGSFDAGLFLPEIVEDLNLERHGLEFVESEAAVFLPQPDGPSLTLWRDLQRSQEEIARFSRKDADRYPEFLYHIGRLAGVLREMMKLTPPDLTNLSTGQLIPWVRPALKIKRLGDREMMGFIRALPMPVEDFLDEWFESPVLKAALGAAGVAGSLRGPKSSGTALMMLYQATRGGDALWGIRYVRGGVGNLAEALASSARERGAEICTGMSVSRILVEDGKAAGVELSGGEHIRARAVVSNLDPKNTFFNLVGAPKLEVRFVREVKNIRTRGGIARVNLALSRLPAFRGIPAGGSIDPARRLTGRILIAPDLEYLERAHDGAKYGEFPRQPFLDIAIPSLLDPTLAPSGEHLMCINVGYAPYRLDGGWEERREELVDLFVETINEYAPGFRETVLARQVLTPVDLENRFGLTEGDIYHGQMDLDQLLFMRPVPGYARYRTPVERLYLCGAGTHPGGGVTGAPGYNAAREIEKDLVMRS